MKDIKITHYASYLDSKYTICYQHNYRYINEINFFYHEGKILPTYIYDESTMNNCVAKFTLKFKK